MRTLATKTQDARRSASERTCEPDEVFRELLVGVMPHLRAFARSLCQRRELADDLAQEALIKAWAARQSYSPDTNFKAWIFTILRNQFFNERRKMSRVVEWDEEAMHRRLVTHQAQESALEIGDLHRALYSLPDEQREALILIGAGGFTYEEVAEIAGCAIGTVKSRVNRARRNLEAKMEKRRPGERLGASDAVTEIFADLDRLAPGKPS